MIPAIRLSYRFSFGENEYGTFIDFPEGEDVERFHDAIDVLLQSAEDTYEYLKKQQEE